MAGKLTAVKVRALTAPGRYGDGKGLWLQVRDAQHRSWLFRFKLFGRERAMGLGPVEDVTLAEAREEADACRKLLRQGIDPIEHRRADRAAKAAAARGITFRDVAERYIAAHAAGWRNAKHAEQWRATLATYAFPVFGDQPVHAIDTGLVMRVLEPIWAAKTETASRLRGRIESVLDYAAARGWRSGENPARWRGHLQKLLPARSKVQRVEHHPALPWRQMGAFMAALRAHDGVAARALEFAILTAARTGEVIGARWAEIDGDVWTVPGERMKAGREHRVPLSAAALAVLSTMKPDGAAPSEFVFPGGRPGRPLSGMALLMLLRRMGRGDLTAHGFRSTFREWTAEATGYPREVAELALAHVNKDKVEAAYQRGDLFEKRRRLMEEWAAFCARPSLGADVLSLQRA
jgi:integrase